MEAKSRLLVIGGTGFIGYHFLTDAIKKKVQVSSLSLNPPNNERLVNGVEYLHGDILNSFELKKILQNKKFEYVVNFGGYIKHTLFHEGGRQFIEEHFTSIQNLIAVLNRDNLIRFVQIGSSDEYGNATAPQNEKLREDPISPYSLGKVASTHFLQMLHRSESFPVSIMRLFLVYGPNQKSNRIIPYVIQNCQTNQAFKISEGKQLRDFIYIDDAVDAIFLALKSSKSNGQIYNLGSGKGITIKVLVNQIRKIIGGGKPKFGSYKNLRQENKRLVAKTNKIKKDLKWKPKVNLENGLNRTIEFYNDE